jgi:hypothetical protein
MNLVGKILVVVILVMSVVFMAFAMAVYSTHKNWRDVVLNDQASAGKPLGLASQLQTALTTNKNLKDDLDKAIKERDAAIVAKDQVRSKLENELDVERKDRRGLETILAQEKKDSRDAVAAMNITQKNTADYRVELDKKRTEVLEAQQDRDKHFKSVVTKTDDLHQAELERDLLKKRMEELAKDLAKARECLRYFDINENSDYKSKNAPRIDAVVTATPGAGLIEISLGSDAGLRKGHLLQVYRTIGGQNTYVGRIEVVKTASDKSVCKIDPKFQNSNVMVGDRVASKLD